MSAIILAYDIRNPTFKVERKRRRTDEQSLIDDLKDENHRAFPAKKRTPSPSATPIIWARPVFERLMIALRRRTVGMPDREDSTGGDVIS